MSLYRSESHRKRSERSRLRRPSVASLSRPFSFWPLIPSTRMFSWRDWSRQPGQREEQGVRTPRRGISQLPSSTGRRRGLFFGRFRRERQSAHRVGHRSSLDCGGLQRGRSASGKARLTKSLALSGTPLLRLDDRSCCLQNHVGAHRFVRDALRRFACEPGSGRPTV